MVSIVFLSYSVASIYTIKAEYFLWIYPWNFLLIIKHSISYLNYFQCYSIDKKKPNLFSTYIYVLLGSFSRE